MIALAYCFGVSVSEKSLLCDNFFLTGLAFNPTREYQETILINLFADSFRTYPLCGDYLKTTCRRMCARS